MKNFLDRWDVLSWLLVAAIWTIAVLAWDRVPAEMPTHWNVSGEADQTVSRDFGLLALPLVATVLAGGFSLAVNAVFLKSSPRIAATTRWIRRTALGVALMLQTAIATSAVNGTLSVARIAVTAAGIVLILVASKVPTYVRRGILRRRAEPTGRLFTRTNGLSVGMLMTVGAGTVAAAGLSLGAQLTILVAGTVVACVVIAMSASG